MTNLFTSRASVLSDPARDILPVTRSDSVELPHVEPDFMQKQLARLR